ncbi:MULTISPECIES: hypothetical protein [Methylorubrum]|uniref:hypothetical protein n=1 Tax=Methylorubrum TaxID=2282523 RepID=UPI00209F30D4|nr:MULTISPECIES: hypothetical protein [Methylorubrum]MCP1551682.1 hypothetical protein [Methylorubrum zatmanii]MCP1556641.1 hypothetical protein [Methylorubrum extorquens]MCP1581730.1 hypothetical protein [Methylorubrum extorquens]
MRDGLFPQPETDVDRILAAIQWPKADNTYDHIIGVVTILAFGGLFEDAPAAVFAEVAEAVQDAHGLTPERRHRCLMQIEARAMLAGQDPCVALLKDRLGVSGTVRLALLIYDGGLTPTEARPWLEPPDRNWPEIEQIVFLILDDACRCGAALPWHLARWLERIRARDGRSLFD